MKISEEDMQRLGRNVNALLTEIKELREEIEEVKLDAYRYKFVRSTCVRTDKDIEGYDKSVDEHIRRRNEKFN